MRKNRLVAACLLIIVFSSVVTVFFLTAPQPAPDTIVLKPYGSLQNAVNGLANGEIDLLPIDKIDPPTLKTLQNNQKIQLVTVPTFDFTYIGLNLRNWPFSDVGFRKAMLFAFDRQFALKSVLGGFGETLHPGLFSTAYSASGWPVYRGDQYGYDTAMARSVLDREGFNMSSSGRFRLDPTSGQPLRTMTIYSRLGQPADVAAADLFAKEMQAIGIPVISLPMQDRDFNLAMHTYMFDAFVDSQSSDSAPTWLINLFFGLNDAYPTPLGTNRIGYSDPAFDSYLADFQSPTESQSAKTAVEKCQEVLASDLPVLPVFSKNILIAANRQLPVQVVTGSLEDTVRKTALAALQNSTFPLPLRIGFGSAFNNLDPTSTSNGADWVALRLLVEPLLTSDNSGALTADLVQRWMISNDWYSITLAIRQDAKFNDGHAITPNDVAATLNWLAKNAKISSPVYGVASEIVNAEVQNQRIVVYLSSPDPYAVYSFIHLFVLPEARLSNGMSSYGFLTNQLLVPSGPFAIREFTQTEGVYLQRNNAFYDEPTPIASLFALEGERVLPGSQLTIQSLPLYANGHAIENATFKICIYDQNATAVKCSTGKYEGGGVYSASTQIDSRFRSGSYREESSLFVTLPTGSCILFDQRTLTLLPLPMILIMVILVLAAGIIVTARGKFAQLWRGHGVKKRRPVRRKSAGQRRGRIHRQLHPLRKRT